MPKFTREEIIASAKNDNVRYLRLMFTDILGTIKKRRSSYQPVGKSIRQQNDVRRFFHRRFCTY
jgi:glutamine synthetase